MKLSWDNFFIISNQYNVCYSSLCRIDHAKATNTYKEKGTKKKGRKAKQTVTMATVVIPSPTPQQQQQPVKNILHETEVMYLDDDDE